MSVSKESARKGDEALKEYLSSLTREALEEIAIGVYQDCDRLRREIDDAKGVIR
jgi:hypothetical protein